MALSTLIGNGADLSELMTRAIDVLNKYSALFQDKLGEPRYVDKGGYDFSTAVDLFLEQHIAQALESSTGIKAHGEEFGGSELSHGLVWVVDPIDGTANYSAGLPVAGILVALIVEGEPVIGICHMPTLGKVFAAYQGSPLYINGMAQAPLQKKSLAGELVGFGSFQSGEGGIYPGDWRIKLLTEISRVTSRIRMLGSTGLSTAYVASGAFVGAVVFGSHIWDNASGYVLVKAAGGIVSDLLGKPWTIDSCGMLAAVPGCYEHLSQIIAQHPLHPIDQDDNLVEMR